MGAARKTIDTMLAIKAIPIIILPFIIYHLHSFAYKKTWLPRGLDVRCNKTFQKLKQLIRSVSPLDFVTETCVPEL